jgi:hypothetical protein
MKCFEHRVMSYLGMIAVCLVALVMGNACDEPGVSNAQDTAIGFGGSVGDQVSPDTTAEDLVLADGNEVDATSEDVATNDAEPEVGGFGWPCNVNGDCLSGYCINTGNKKVCTETCDTSCPDDFVCAPVSTTGADMAYICLPRYDKLCQPCREHKDCQPLFGAGTDLCLDYGDEGKFCGADCQDGSCPDGYTCSSETAGDGVIVSQCRRVAGGSSCPCTPLSKYLALATDCSITNELGTCPGSRSCAGPGLSACIGQTPVEDICDGFDNDCDGIIDNGSPVDCIVSNQFGQCPGQTLCQNGQEICDGPKPALEACDGIDNDCNGFVDEGYPDNDGDELADCVDPDDDNDGALDEIDNCPKTPNPEQQNADGDPKGDACDLDDDGDGAQDLSDCDPLNPFIYPFAAEICDGLDNDCDGLKDEQTCDDQNNCTSNVCDPLQGCVFDYLNVPCNDANPCTVSDQCSFGVCTGSFIDCSDNNSCTTDTCDPNFGCANQPSAGPCDDGDPCTEDDVCNQGFCKGTPAGCECTTNADCLDMDDGNLCNGVPICDKSGNEAKCIIDPESIVECGLPGNANPACAKSTCDPQTGQCQIASVNDGQLCNDANKCTQNDICLDGTCVGQSVDCDDDNLCTNEACSPETGCITVYNNAPCDDGNTCTISDACNGGVCVGGDPFPCNDGNPCTDDACLQGVGCQYVANNSPCDDGNVCTKDDTCNAKTCQGGIALGCDDGNVCTVDVCNPVQGGCVHTSIAGVCDDGDPCSIGDACVGGVCKPSSEVSCDDGNSCTQDACVGGDCKHISLDGLDCDDGNNCTQNDSCVAGVCLGSGDEGCCKSNNDCDDGNPCTQDLCSLQTGVCSHNADVMNGISCNADSNGCTAGDQCSNGSCVVGSDVDCGQNGDVCSTLSCQSTGIQSYLCAKTPKNEGTPCDDGLYCTTDDACNAAGDCQGGTPLDCNEVAGGCLEATCNEATDSCEGVPVQDGTPCNADDNGCSEGDSCVAGSCEPGKLADCSIFADQCTDYSCASVDKDTYTCIADPKKEGTECDDGLYCTSNDACDGTGWCKSGGSDPCSDAANACNTANCNELTDSCDFDPKQDGTPCNDGDACTSGDNCQAGACVAPDIVCGEFKVSTYKSANSPISIADLGEGRTAFFWSGAKNNDSSGDWPDAWGRNFTATWSREDVEFRNVDAYNSLSPVILPHDDGGAVYIEAYGCHNCGGCSGRRDRHIVHITRRDAMNKLVKTKEGDSVWGPDYCSTGWHANTYANHWQFIRAVKRPNGDFLTGVVDDNNLRIRIFRSSDLASIYTNGDVGYGIDGYDLGTFGDNRWIVTWSESNEIWAQMYNAANQLDGVKFQVNSETSGNQRYPRMATLSGGRFVIVWRSYKTGHWQLRGQVFKASGNKLGVEFAIHDEDAVHNEYQVVEYNQETETFAVVWQANDSNGNGIFGRRFDKNGFAITDTVSLNLKEAGNQRYPGMETLSTGELVVGWMGDDHHVYARKFDEAWNPIEDVAETAVNTNAQNDQVLQDSASLTDSTLVAVWTETNNDDGNSEVRARIVNAVEPSESVDFTVNETVDYWQLNPEVSSDTAGNFVVVWDSFGQDGDAEGVFMRRYNKDGEALGSEEQVNETTDNEQVNPSVAMNPDGSWVVVWETYAHPGGNSYDIIAQCYSKAGQKIGGEVVVNKTLDKAQRQPTVTYVNSPPRYIVNWESFEQDGSSWGIFGQMLNTSCAKLGSEFDVNSHTSGVQRKPDVAADTNGRFTVVWESENQDGSSWGVYGQKFSADGSKDGSEFKFAYSESGQQLSPSITYLKDSGFMVGWESDNVDESGRAVKYQRYDAEGAIVGLEFVGNITSASNQTMPSVVPLGEGYGILWTSEGQDGDKGSIVGRWFP